MTDTALREWLIGIYRKAKAADDGRRVPRSDILIEDCTVTPCAAFGIRVRHACIGVTIRGNTIDGELKPTPKEAP